VKNRTQQQGVFSIEMAFVLLGMSACLYFCFDLGFQQIRKSQLERVSYSLVSALKERSLFHPTINNKPSYKVEPQEVKQLHNIAAAMLNVKKKDVSVIVSSRLPKGKTQSLSALSPNVPCRTYSPISTKLVVTTESINQEVAIYQVTLCQIVPAWFERVIGGEAQKNDRVLSAHATFIGR